MALYLVPGTRENIERTIECALGDIEALKLIDPSTQSQVQERTGIEGFRLWAMTKAHRSIFRRMELGDDVMISEKGTGKFTHYGRVCGKTENRALGEKIWPYAGEKPWELIYFLSDVRRIDLPKSEVLQKLGYSPTDMLAGARRANPLGLKGFVAIYGNIADLVGVKRQLESDSDEHGLNDDVFTSENVLTEAMRRKGQGIFSRRVKRNYRGRCALCGITEARFLVAGHIVGWAEDRENRLNPTNGICFCVLHDRAFEAGYFTLDPDLRVRISPRLTEHSALGAQLAPYAQKRLESPLANPPDEQFLVQHRLRLLS